MSRKCKEKGIEEEMTLTRLSNKMDNILDLVMTRFDIIDNKIDSLGERLDKRIDDLTDYVNDGFVLIGNRFDTLEGKMAKKYELQKLSTRVDLLEAPLKRVQ